MDVSTGFHHLDHDDLFTANLPRQIGEQWMQGGDFQRLCLETDGREPDEGNQSAAHD
jgi:hypothetical protein